MAKFIECSIRSITYSRGTLVENDPVNIDLCKRLRKSTLNWYPDNTGKPSIEFDGCDARWVFNTEADRDADYDKIVTA